MKRPKYLTPVSQRFRTHVKLTPAERTAGWIIVTIVVIGSIAIPYFLFQ